MMNSHTFFEICDKIPEELETNQESTLDKDSDFEFDAPMFVDFQQENMISCSSSCHIGCETFDSDWFDCFHESHEKADILTEMQSLKKKTPQERKNEKEFSQKKAKQQENQQEKDILALLKNHNQKITFLKSQKKTNSSHCKEKPMQEKREKLVVEKKASKVEENDAEILQLLSFHNSKVLEKKSLYNLDGRKKADKEEENRTKKRVAKTTFCGSFYQEKMRNP
eukprot:Sdes_comp19927_c0_seq1m12369